MKLAVHLLLTCILAVVTSGVCDEYPCPKWAHIHLASLRCYWMSTLPSSWLKAQEVCQQTSGGDLARVNSTEDQLFILSSFPLGASVWIWVKDGRKRDGTQQWESGSGTQRLCAQMALGSVGQWRNSSCSREHHFLCEKEVPVTLPSVDAFLTGVPLMSRVYAMTQVPALSAPPDLGQQRVKMMLFPGLWFSHAGQVLSVQLVTKPYAQHTHARVQILRPYCSPSLHLVPPGCSSLHNPFSCCSLVPLCNTTGGCAAGQYWCHLLETCLPVTSPCSPYDSPAGGPTFPLPPRYPAVVPFYHLVADIPLSFPPSSELAHINVVLPQKEISVYPDDILAVQHTGPAGSFLQCSSSSRSPWQQSYLSLPGPERGGWWEGGLSSVPAGEQWFDGVVCDLRVIYADTLHSYAISPMLSTDHSDPSGYTHTGTISTPLRTTQARNAGQVESIVLGLSIVHPAVSKDGEIHLPINIPTLIVIKILSGSNATSVWSAPVSQTGIPFESYCPPMLPLSHTGCERDTPDAWFSHASVVLSTTGALILNISALNHVSSQSMSVKLQAHHPVKGLRIQPHGDQRMLVDVSQVFQAMVDSGSAVKYTWVIDNLVQFAYEGQTYSVVFKKPAEYKLNVTAKNPVSSQSLVVKLSVEVMNPLADPSFPSLKEVIAVNTQQLFTFRVKVDISIGITFWWDFGDNTPGANHSFLPSSQPQGPQREHGMRQIFLQDSISHTYKQPDDYRLRVQVFNKYDRLEKAVQLKVRSPLVWLHISPSPPVPLVNQTFDLEALPWPSPYGILYKWNFGDNSKEIKGFGRKVSHIHRSAGVYNVTVSANNTLSALTAWMLVEIVEKISGVQLSYNGPSELGSTTSVKGVVSSGTSLRWTFDMGDESLFTNLSNGFISYIYKSPGNYSVRVTVVNSVSQAVQHLRVEVYKLTVLGILPSGCLKSGEEVYLRTLVMGVIPVLTFHWNFGDGTPTSVFKGNSEVWHIYSSPGQYKINVTVVSSVGSTFYLSSICIEASITGLTLGSPAEAVAVGKEICFNVSVYPKLIQPHSLQFQWYNSSHNANPAIGPSYFCFVFEEAGTHQISVLASNNVSNKTANAVISVQEPVTELTVKYEGYSGALLINHAYLFWVETCSGTNVTIQWDFGDGSPREDGQYVSHVFTSAQEYRVSATAVNDVSQELVTMEVVVQVPVSGLTLKIPKPVSEAGEETVVIAVTNDMRNVSFYWSVDPSVPLQPGASIFTYVFLKAGIYHIHAIAQNAVSKQEMTTTVEVLERIQGLHITSESIFSAGYIPTQENVNLTASVMSGSNLTYQWLVLQNGTNKTASDEESFQLFADTPGDVLVWVIVSNALGNMNNSILLRAVEQVSGVTVSTLRDIVPIGKPVKISVNVETGTDLQYLWYFGPSQSSLSDVPSLVHVFGDLGHFVVRVLVRNVLGSREATKELTVQEEVHEVNFQINSKTNPFLVSSSSALKMSGSVEKGNNLSWEWKYSKMNGISGILGKQQTIIYSFLDAGVYQVSLNASNDISWQTVSHSVAVQDVVQGLTLNVSSFTLCANDPIVFTPKILKGSNVSFSLEFSDAKLPVHLIQNNLTTSDLTVGNHTVTARAWNQVSTSSVALTVQVVEKVLGLQLVNCCSLILESMKEVTFQAKVLNGSPVVFYWNFHLVGLQPSQKTGQNVSYTPPRNGSLTINVEASNGLCSQSLSEKTSIQWPIQQVRLVSNSTQIFIDYSISFSAITDSGSNLKFMWDFGDSIKAQLITESDSVSHQYHIPGNYIVQVTAFNSISKTLAQLPIEVRTLECTLPKISLVQSQAVIQRSRPSYFEARVDLQGCTVYKTIYHWEVRQAPGCSEDDRLPLDNVAGKLTPLLILPRHILAVGSYCIKFTVGLQGTPLFQHQSMNITVVHGQLVPIIKGGSHRLWSSHNDLLLDGTESYDPDDGVQEGEPLQYHWDYVMENTDITLPLSPPALTNGSVLILPHRMLQPGSVYLFTLTIQKQGRSPVSSTQSVTVQRKQVLPVTVDCVTCSSFLPFHHSHSRPLALSGHCLSDNKNTQYRWSAEGSNDEVLELNEITTSTGPSSPDLVVRPGVLMDGLNYTFTLNVSQPGMELWGTASITLQPHHPPSGGVCTLTPDSGIHLLETVVTYNCSGWVDGDGNSAQLRYTLQVEACVDASQPCRLLTLYRGTQHSFGTLVPLGSPVLEGNLSVITALVLVEDDLGATVTALNRTLTVLLSEVQGLTGWLKNKSQSELWPLVQQGNPQEVVPYSIALTSHLNQVDSTSEQDLQDRMVIRENLTRALASLPVSSLQDAAQISSALAQCMAVPRELACTGCQDTVLKALGKMISVIAEQTEPGDVAPLDTGKNILQILGSSLTVAANPVTASGQKNHGYLGSSEASDAAVSAYGQAGELMRSLMRSRLRGEEAVTLTAPQITAVGRRSDPADLLCTERSGSCQFYIPRGLSTQLSREREEVVQILLGIDSDTPFIPAAHPPISTTLAAMEFATPQGRPVPVANLPPDRAIRVLLPSRFPSKVTAARNLTLPNHGSINFTVGTVETDPHAGLFLTFNFSLLPGTGPESSGQVVIMVDSQPVPTLSQHGFIQELNLSLSAESPAVEVTVFLTPLQNRSGQALHVNVSSVLRGGTVQASLCVFSSLCQYFSPEQRRWSSQGLSPLRGSSPREAHCLSQHLTLFGASLFVYPDALILLPPPEGPVKNVVAGIVCATLLLIHLLIALISHKLDHLDSTRSGVVPLCGQSGRYQYRVLIKTGWGSGSGTTAHVGISLYGLNKSGSRHLQCEGAFQRNALDHFQVETDANLGEIWKIRIWHDNTGLSPAWFLQHVVVWDKQTDNMYFFLVEDWLSVENEKNDGMVEKEVLASCPQDLQQFSRVLRSQLVFGMFERHLWVSVWERPSHNNFTRAQRVMCCALVLHLYLAVGAVWYGAAGLKGTSSPVSVQLLMNAETVAVGMTMAVLVFPLHLLFCFLFRMTGSSKVTVDESAPPSPVSQTVEMDVYLSHSEQASSYFLSLPGGLDSILDGVSHSSESLGSKQIDSALWNASQLGTERVEQWDSCDSIFDLPELQGAVPLGHARLLKRKKALLQLRLGSPACTPDQPHSLSTPDLIHSDGLQHNPLTLSEEDLIQSIATGAAAASSSSSGRVTSDSGRYSPCETTMSDSQESSCSGWSELSQEEPPYRTGLYKSPSSLSVFTAASTFLPSPSPDNLGTSSTTRIGVARSTPGRLLPSWVLGVTNLLAGLFLGASLALVGLYGSSFSSSVLLMWLISTVSAFLTSALLLEPLKVCLQALFLAAVVRPVDPEVEDRLGQEAAVRRGGGELGGKVRPPCGYGLLHAKEEARKARTLRSLMKSCLVHMLFLLVVLLVNYQDSALTMQGRLLHSAVKRSLLTAPPGMLNLSSLTRWPDAWQWMDSTLVPYLYQSPSLLLLGLPRIQRVQSKNGCCGNVTDSLGFRSALFAPVVPASSHVPSGEQRDSAHSSCSGRLLSWLWPRPCCEGASGGADTAYLGNSSELTRQLLSGLHNTHWIDAMTKAVYVDFTQYHRETALFVAVTVMLEWSRADTVLTTVSIEPFHVPPSHSGPDLQIAMMVLLLVFALSFLGSVLWRGVRERGRGLLYGHQCLQLLVSVLSLATVVLRIFFLYKSASCLSHHGSQPQTFTDFHSAALLAQMSSQLSALLLTLLVLKMVGVLRFVRRWVVFGRVLLQAWRELCGVVLMLVLMLLVFSHTGSLLFSSSVEGFRTLGQTSFTLASALRGRVATQRLCERHPMLGPLYCLSVAGTGLWVLGRLCGAVLMRSYKAAQAEMYRPAMEPQDYEMVEFFIKRLKLWMGLSKTKEFRHKVKFEGMVSPPSRSSLGSQLSSLSAHSPGGQRLASAQSLGSEDSCLSDSYDVQLYLDRLLPAVNNMLSQFDRVNQLTDDLHCIELKLQEAQSRIAQKMKQQVTTCRKAWRISVSTPPPCASPTTSPLPSPPPLNLPSFISCNPTIPCTRSIFSESMMSWHSPHLHKAAHPSMADMNVPVRRVSGADASIRRIPGRRAWHSGTSHSADAAQRSPQPACSTVRARPWSEEGGRSMACDRAPVKRRAWHPEGPEIVGTMPSNTASQCYDF